MTDLVIQLAARLAAVERRLASMTSTSQLAYSSIEDGAVQVYDSNGSLRAVIGQQADGTTGINVTNGPAPPMPSLPEVQPALAALTIAWDGTWEGTDTTPLDWSRVEVHIGPEEHFVADQGTLRDTIETPQGGTVTAPLPYTQWWVRLRARTAAGVAGPATAAVAGTPRRAATADLQAGAITAELLAADAIVGKTITGGVLTGVEINGATLRTATSGSRVEITSVPGSDQQLASGRVRLFSGSPQERAPAAAYATYDAATNASRLTLMSAEVVDPAPPPGQVSAFSAGTPWPMASAELWSDSQSAHIDLNAESVYASGDLSVRYELNVGSSVEIGSTCGQVTPTGDWNFIASNRYFSHVRIGGNEIIGAKNGAWESLLLNANLVVDKDGWIARTGHENWEPITFGTGWGNWGSGYDLVAHKIYPDRTVGLRGLCKRTAKTTPATGEVLVTLPPGARPLTYIQQFAVIVPNNGAALTVNISPSGTLALASLTAAATTALAAGNGYLDLGVIRFPID
ncbi:hypothetical protein [Streptomyces sp. H39-C1]|uniref:hypothetical protein n=1 Tax=Streptomyces sp. H39-C1 TaxID=3004355 RepID=UPI0022AF5413|nr:hypothetical protein [Streptomyces sp. H39-C1]MCZ4098308.1 hypothetical protein [Streptomyces sp. H39-C1]